MLGKLAKYGLLWGLGAYALDVPVRRSLNARKARAYANAKGKPLLNIGAGTDDTAMFGATYYGDVNADLSGRKDIPHGTLGAITYADAQDLSEFEDGQFGAVFACHLLEHLPEPDKAVKEWLRVSGNDPNALFIVTPSWWSPVTWLHPNHRNYYTDGAGGTRGGRKVHLRDEMNPTLAKITSLRDYHD